MFDDDIENRCKELLQQLKCKQAKLNGLVLPGVIPPSDNVYNSAHSKEKPVYVKGKFDRSMKLVTCDHIPTASRRDREAAELQIFDSAPKPKSVTIQSAYDDAYQDDETKQKSVHLTSDSSLERPKPFEISDLYSYSYSTDDILPKKRTGLLSSVTPRTKSRRQLIDRNIKVGSEFTDLANVDSNDQSDHLNFSYSHHIDASDFSPRDFYYAPSSCTEADHAHQAESNQGDLDETELKGRPQKHVTLVDGLCSEDGSTLRKESKRERNTRDLSFNTLLGHVNCEVLPADIDSDGYCRNLRDEGNNKRLVSLLKDSLKSHNSSKTSLSRINLSNNARPSMSGQEQRLLGYDWIAALLDNDTDLINETESFFQDIKDFRRINKDQCSNQFYMEGPLSLAIDLKPSPVVAAISEPKVKPYVVNDRLFTTPLKKCLLDDLGAMNDEEEKQIEKQKEPSFEEPRFVRVSIPRSTLETPSRMQPHRRSSFDATDSCALSQHCLLGWESSRPAMLPAATTISLSDATGELQSRLTTTLGEAERLASLYSWPATEPTTHRPDLFPSWRKEYQSLLNMTTMTSKSATALTSNSVTGRNSNNVTSRSVTARGNVKRNTDDLLNSTYSLMYEMERLKKERELSRETKTVT